MKRLFISMFIYLLIVCYYADCQTISSVNNLEELWLEMEIEEEEETGYEEFWNELLYLANHPLDINKATAEEWKKLPFLTDPQIEELVSYKDQYGEMVSIYELKNIRTLDHKSIRMLLPFVYINENPVNNRRITVDNLFKYGRNELITRFDKTFQQKKGYSALPDSVLAANPNKKYLGEPFYHSIRYSYMYDTHIQAGVITEKDAGEPFWNDYHKGYDYYSFHIVVKDINRLKTLVAGDYKASFGQGLVMSQDYSPGRSAMVIQADRRTNGFRRHFSTNEFDYLRGIAGTYAVLPAVDISFFYSVRRMDGIIDSVYIRSIKKDGFHRIERDQERKRTISLQSWGGNIRYATHSLVIGVTGIMTSWGDQLFHPEEKPYNLYYFRGRDHLNVGVDYLWKKKL